MSTTVLPRISHRMSPASQAVLAYVASNANCTFAVLRDVFHPGYKSGGLHAFRSKLNYLSKAGHLAIIYTDGVCAYQTGSGVPRRKPDLAIETDTVPVYVDSCARLVPSAQYDRMHGPAYVPPAEHCARSGGLDYKRHPSRGFSC